MAVAEEMQTFVGDKNDLSKIKSCLLKNIKVNSRPKKKHVDKFVDLIEMHSKNHQLPEFFDKVFQSLEEILKEDSSSIFISKGFFAKEVLQSMRSSFYELPFGQTIELWKMFSDTFSSIFDQNRKQSKGSVFFVAQVYSNFLLHTKLFDKCLPESVIVKYKNMITSCLNELKNISLFSLDTADEERYLTRSVLLLYSSLIQLTFEYSMCGKSVESENPLNFSVLGDVFNANPVNFFKDILNGNDKVLSYFVINLLCLKIKIIAHSTDTKVLSKSMNLSLKLIVAHAREVSKHGAPWNSNVCTIDDSNYGTAIWQLILPLLPAVLKSMTNEDILNFAKSVHEIAMQPNVSDERYLKSHLLSRLNEDGFQNSKSFQTAFVSSLWNLQTYCKHNKRTASEMEIDITYATILKQLSIFHRKWIDYSDTIPKLSEKESLNPLWQNIKDACDNLNELMKSESGVKTKLKPAVYEILELVDCLPLAYLLPANQVRCITGLSILFFSIPDTCCHEDVVKFASKISLQIVDILDGVRSIWLFDFVSSGALLREFANAVQRILNTNPNASRQWSTMLFERLIFHMMKQVGPLKASREQLSQIFDKSSATESSVTILLLVLKQANKILQRPRLKPEYKSELDQMAATACKSCVKLIKMIDSDSSLFRILTECYMTVVEMLFLPSCNIDAKSAKKYLKHLPKMIEFGRQNVLDQKCDHKPFFRFFAKMCQSYEILETVIDIEDITPVIWDCFYSHITNSYLSNYDMGASCSSDDFEFDKDEEELLKSLFLNLKKEKMNEIFREIMQRLESFNGEALCRRSLQLDLKLTRYVIESVLTKMKDKFPVNVIKKVVDLLSRILGQTSHTSEDLSIVKIPLLKFCRFLIKLRSNKMPKDLLMQCFNFCMKVRLCDQNENIPLFVKAFNAEWDLVHDILVKHERVVKLHPRVFISVTSNLLKAVVSASSEENFESNDEAMQTQMVSCAQNMERLFTLFSQHEAEFFKLVPYLIADYVDCVQHITLADKIKVHLISGVNRLLSICDENSLQTISVNLNPSCHNIFVNLMERHKQLNHR